MLGRIGLLGLALLAAVPAQAQTSVLVEYGIGLTDDFLVTINRYNVRRAGTAADVLASVKFAQPWTRPGVLESNQKWIRYRMDCTTGRHHRAVAEQGNDPLTNPNSAEGERVLMAVPLVTTPLGSPLHQAMCKGTEEKLDLASPWPAYDIALGGTTDTVALVNPDVQKFPNNLGGMEEMFARARFAKAREIALAGIKTWDAPKAVAGLPKTGFQPVAMPFTFHENLYKTVIDRAFVNYVTVQQWGDGLFMYNVVASGRTIHSKAGKPQPAQVFVMLVRCAPKPQQMISNAFLITLAPEKYRTIPVPHAAMQWSDNVGEFSRGLCTRQTRFTAPALPDDAAMHRELAKTVYPLPIGS